MTVFPLLAKMGFFMTLVAIVFIICAVILVLLILIQKGRGGGLSGAFGGGGMAGGILGSKTGDFLTWVTIAMAGLFLTLAVVMAKFYKPSVSDFGENGAVQQKTVPAEQQPKPELPLVPAVTSDANN